VKHLSSNWMLAVAAAAGAVISAAGPLHAEQLEKTRKVAGTTVHYKVLSPACHLYERHWPDASARMPTSAAFPVRHGREL
jgi:hypothetical protein